ncbi:MAG: transketolase family protein [Bradymonadales bacterium]|nr:MAG: transketolase family protein [Bradymonadales bacterium]
MKATRDSFGEEIAVLGELHPEIVVLDADLSKSTKSEKFAKKFPNRFFQMGIAEANMIGTAAGLALSGKLPYACSFGCFLTGRYDQIRMSVAYNEASVRLIGTHAGVAIGEDGHSQMGLEDVALLRSLPNMSIFQPADDTEARAMLRYSVKHQGPCYFRLTRQKLPDIFSGADYSYEYGKWPVLNKGSRVALIASGGLVGSCLEANKKLGGKFSVVNASTLKPVDRDLIARLAQTHSLLVTAEDHYVEGGLGTAVAEVLSEIPEKAILRRIGMRRFGESGSPEDLYRFFGFDADGICEQVEKFQELVSNS